MDLMGYIMFCSTCAVILGAPTPSLAPSRHLRASHNEEGQFQNNLSLSASDCSTWGSVSWALLAVAIVALPAFFATLIHVIKEKRKNSPSRDNNESRRLLAENRSSRHSFSFVYCGLILVVILALVLFLVMFISLFEENPPSKCSTWKPVSWVFFAAGLVALPALAVMLILLIEVKRSQRSRPEESKSIQADELKAINDELKAMNEILKIEKELSDVRFSRADVILDPRTAHPKLEVSKDGKVVWNTGKFSKVSDWEERFDSHTFLLAVEGFSEGKHYWEVEIGQKKAWDLGVASETICRKGEITLSPKNGYWVIGCDDGKNYQARTEQWTRLQVNGKLTKLGIFLDMSTGSVSFYDVCRKSKLYSYTIPSCGKLYPFLSTGPVTAELDSSPLRIPPWIKEE